MIVRYYINCAHCNSIILLRIGIGYSPEQSFSFNCKKCSTTIFGILSIEGPQKGIKVLKNAAQNKLFNGVPNQTVTCHEDFLINKDNNNVFSSPFLDTVAAMGGAGMLLFGHDRDEFESNQKNLRERLFRINNFYIKNRFVELRKEFEDTIPDSIFGYTSAVVSINKQYLDPILDRSKIDSDLAVFHTKIKMLITNNESELLKLLNKLNNIGHFEKQLKENLQLIERFDSLFDEFKPIITLNYMKKRDISIGQLKFSHVNFEHVKQFYVDLFECVGRELNLLIGLRNIELNSDFNKLDIPRYNKITNFESFAAESNGNKKQFLKDFADYYNIINYLFDVRLRNGIGHYKTKLTEDMNIIYYPNKKDLKEEKGEIIAYSDFMKKTYGLFNLLIVLMHMKFFLQSYLEN